MFFISGKQYVTFNHLGSLVQILYNLFRKEMKIQADEPNVLKGLGFFDPHWMNSLIVRSSREEGGNFCHFYRGNLFAIESS
jgi:hypothetical protein